MASAPHMAALASGPVPELAFAVTGAERVEYAAVPTLRFLLDVRSLRGHAIRSVLLDAQVQIAARRRAYDAAAQERLYHLFGAAQGWGTTLRTLLWSRTTLVVPPFSERTVIGLPVVCSYDLEVAASRYFDALPDGEVPLEFLFSGTVFYAGEDGRLQTVRISWESDAEFRFPVRVWKETMEHYFPGSAWLRLDKDAFDRLAAYRARHALATWEQTVDALVEAAEQ
jgi:hypothetical protein